MKQDTLIIVQKKTFKHFTRHAVNIEKSTNRKKSGWIEGIMRFTIGFGIGKLGNLYVGLTFKCLAQILCNSGRA